MKKTNFKKRLLDMIQIIFGTLIMSVGIKQFLLPNHLSTGGFSGIATITYYLFNWKIGYVIVLLNIPFFIFAFIRIGKEFLFKTIVGTFSLSIFLDLFEKLKPLTTDNFLACIYGGIILGIGSSLVFRVGASTGGSDLICYIIKSFKPMLQTSTVIVVSDAIIIALNVICFKEIEIGLYSAISIYLMGKVIDIFFEGIDFSKMIFIISDKYEEINKSIETNIVRGVTGIKSKGLFTNNERIMLMCVASRSEVIKIRQIISEIDPKAFIVITNAREVYGKGFKQTGKQIA